MGPHEILPGRLLQFGDGPDGFVQQIDDIGESVPDKTADADHHVDSRMAQFLSRNPLTADDPPVD